MLTPEFKELYSEYIKDSQAPVAAMFQDIGSLQRENKLAAELVLKIIGGRRLAVILGAGVSDECGIPLWKDLVRGLIGSAFPRGLRGQVSRARMDETRKIRLLELYQMHYHLSLRDILYRKTRVPKQSTLRYTADFVAKCLQRRVLDRVVTYNFDGLLEEELAARHPSAKVITIAAAENYLFEKDTLHVIHPHGYIARDFSEDEQLTTPLVFSETDYHSQFLDTLFWANRAQLSTFDDKGCLFIGISFNDPNHRRLLDATRRDGEPRHVAILRWNSANVVSNLLVRNDLLSFGIRPLWVKSFKEVDNMLRRLTPS